MHKTSKRNSANYFNAFILRVLLFLFATVGGKINGVGGKLVGDAGNIAANGGNRFF